MFPIHVKIPLSVRTCPSNLCIWAIYSSHCVGRNATVEEDHTWLLFPSTELINVREKAGHGADRRRGLFVDGRLRVENC